MKKFIIPVIAFLFAEVFGGCQSGSENKMSAEDYSKFQQTGDKISNITQGVLLANVGEAIQKGGPKNAVSFCNLNASLIADSLNQKYNCQISRVSAKNRNPGNALQNKTDNLLWKFFSAQSPNGSSKDTIVSLNGEITYYKPINIGMPACLKCHGVPGQDIDPETFTELQKLYPNDLATNYKLNDFRGLWKIKFQTPSN